MLTQLITVKARLGLSQFEVKEDTMLLNAIKGISARFDRDCQRTLARTEDAVEEFIADEQEIRPACYPIESVRKFELKRNEAEGWLEQPGLEHLVRRQCVISLPAQLGTGEEQGRVTYTGGYLLPGSQIEAGQTVLPDDLEQSAIEQVVFWFQNRDKVGVIRQWPKGGTYEQFGDLDLLQNVRAILQRYERWVA